MDLSHVLRRALVLSILLSGLVALVGGVVGGVVAGGPGVVSALIGAGLALAFFGITTLSVMIGRRLGTVGLVALVGGGWMVKVIGFIVVLALLGRASFVNGPVLFFCLVAVSLGTVGIDATVFMRARLPLLDVPDDSPSGGPSGRP